MASKTPNTIWLKGDPQGREGIATEVILPGMLLSLTAAPAAVVSDGRIQGVKIHAEADGTAQMAVAREGDIFGRSIDDEYAVNDTVLYHQFRKGDMFYGLVANGQNVAVGTRLASNGDGSFRVAAAALEEAAGDEAIAVSCEAVNNTSGSAARLKIEVI